METQEKSKQLHLNIPTEVYSRLKNDAKARKWSINTLLVDIVENWLKKPE